MNEAGRLSSPVLDKLWSTGGTQKTLSVYFSIFNMAPLKNITIVKWSEILNCCRLPAQQTPRGHVLSLKWFVSAYPPAAISFSFFLTCWLHIDLSNARHFWALWQTSCYSSSSPMLYFKKHWPVVCPVAHNVDSRMPIFLQWRYLFSHIITLWFKERKWIDASLGKKYDGYMTQCSSKHIYHEVRISPM